MKRKKWNGYENWRLYDINDYINFVNDSFLETDFIKEKYKISYWNHPCSFDIEVTSFEVEDKKYATMYIWQLGMNGNVIYGRTWQQLGILLSYIHNKLELGNKRRIIIYVHNLMYEFQFIRKYFEWDYVFAPKKRRPVYAVSNGFEFKCSYFLSNYSLEYIGENLLHKYPTEKLVGYLDYSKKRHYNTPLTEDELQYCIQDVRVVMCYIQQKIEDDGNITKIPLTNTGYVRNYCRQKCFYGFSKDVNLRLKTQKDYHVIMNNTTINSEDEYYSLKAAFAGGFTHGNIFYLRDIMENVGSADLTSSYPFCMVARYFPMGEPLYMDKVEYASIFSTYLHNFCCIFDIEFINLKPKLLYENYIPVYGSVIKGNYVVNNNKIVSADRLFRTMTELDYDICTRFYTWDKITITNMYAYPKGYLPKDFILAILELYKDKTSLKGVFGKETEYLVSKGMLNAAYGMMVTAIVRRDFEYFDEWVEIAQEIFPQLEAYNKNFNRFLSYAWGVYVTAHARWNLFTAIEAFGEDYVYADTDSIKGINFENHMEYFKTYNDNVYKELETVCNYYDIPFEMCKPKTIEGEEKLLGIWEIEKGYKRFKTIGAKRYLYEYEDGFLQMTVSGVNKKFAMPYLIAKTNGISENSKEYKTLQTAYRGQSKEAIQSVIDKHYEYDMIFGMFDDGLYVPPGHTGKQLITYIDYEYETELTDYLGNTETIYEQSGIHMQEEEYRISIAADLWNYINMVEEMDMTH